MSARMQWVRTLAALIALSATATAASAQASCNGSLPVKPSKSVTFLDFNLTLQPKLATEIKCVDAERLRGAIFAANPTIPAASFGDVKALSERIAALEANLAAKRADLLKAKDRAGRQLILSGVQMAAAAALAVGSTAVCVTRPSGCPALVVELVAIVQAVYTMGDVPGDLAKTAADTIPVIQRTEQELLAARTALNASMQQQLLDRYAVVSAALCRSIQAQCL